MAMRQLAILIALTALVPLNMSAQEPAARILSIHVEVDSTQVWRDEYVLRPLAPGLRSQPLADVVDHVPVRIALRPQPVIDLSHIRSAEAEFVEGFGEFTVWVALTREGVDRLAETTAEVVGARLGIVWDGEVISMPYIRSPMRSAWRIPVYYSSSRSDAESLAKQVNAAVSP